MKFWILVFVFYFTSFLFLFVMPVNFYTNVNDFEIEEVVDEKLKEADLSNNFFKACKLSNLEFTNCAKKLVKKQIAIKKFDQVFFDNLFTDLNYLLDSHEITEASCHSVSHEIGYQANLVNKSPSKSLEYDPYKNNFSFICANGYVHGIIGNGIESSKLQNELIEKLAQQFQTGELNGKRNIYISGMHELGHFVFQNSKDIPEAIKTCEIISKSRDKLLSCHTGIFMDYFQVVDDLKEKVSIDYCKKYQDNSDLAEYSCLLVNSRSANFLAKNYQKISDFCNLYRDDKKHFACNRRFIMEIFGKKGKTPIVISRKFCMNQSSLEYKVHCLYSLSYDILRNEEKFEKKDLTKTLCSDFAFVNNIRCRQKLERDFAGNMFFTLPEDLDLSVPSFWSFLFG